MKTNKLLIAWIAFVLLFPVGCRPSPEPTEDTYGDAQPLIDLLHNNNGIKSNKFLEIGFRLRRQRPLPPAARYAD